MLGSAVAVAIVNLVANVANPAGTLVNASTFATYSILLLDDA